MIGHKLKRKPDTLLGTQARRAVATGRPDRSATRNLTSAAGPPIVLARLGNRTTLVWTGQRLSAGFGLLPERAGRAFSTQHSAKAANEVGVEEFSAANTGVSARAVFYQATFIPNWNCRGSYAAVAVPAGQDEPSQSWFTAATLKRLARLNMSTIRSRFMRSWK